MAVGSAIGQGLPKRHHVEIVVGAKRKVDRLSIRIQPLADRSLQARNRSAQCTPSVGLVGVGVEERRHCVTRSWVCP